MKDAPQKDKGFFLAEDCDLDAFAALTDRRLRSDEVPLAHEIVNNVPVYHADTLGDLSNRDLLTEWANGLRWGAGIVAIKGAYRDTSVLDAATEIYNRIIAEEKISSGGGADHFANAGSNARIWNSLQKLCAADPSVFARYFGNPVLDAVCRAWLGPNYQMTAQVNLVRPGGAAQQAHRDYHLGFQTAEIAASYPAHVHDLSPVLTLQGAVAHGDMPIESGPTKLLPFSQAYRPGYAAWRRPDFRAYFEDHYVQIPLEKGDLLFFNPATFHAAGENVSPGIQRMANLLQVSSAFGRAMETIDRTQMCKTLFPALAALRASGALAPDQLSAAIAACAEGYSFPTNLDRDPPVGGLAPITQNAIMHQALEENWTPEAFAEALDALESRRQP